MTQQRLTGVEVPEDAVIVGEIAVVSFLDADGTERWSLSLGGTMLQSQVIGLLTMAQHGLMAE